MVVTVEVIVSVEDEVGTVTVVGMVVAHMAAVTAMEGDLAVEEMVVVEGHTVVVTEMAVDRLAAMVDQEVRTAVVGMTEGHMGEVVVAAVMVTAVVAEMVVEIHMAAVVKVEVTMKCSLNRTQYLFRVFPIKSQNQSLHSILAPLV